MNPFRTLKRLLKNSEASKQLLTEIRDTIANQRDLTKECLNMLQHIAAGGDKNILEQLQLQAPQFKDQEAATVKDVVSRLPLMLADKTFNTAHPEYDATLARNFPGLIFNGENRVKNEAYKALSSMMEKKKGNLTVPDESWKKVLDEMLKEIKTIPHSAQVFERKAFIENYIIDLSRRFQAHYRAGWVNLEDALYLYWLVRVLKPKTIVQTGVCNGLSTAFMMLGLAKNGPEGRIHVIDIPYIFNSQDPAWTIKDHIYGVIIPEGKSSGWMVPDAYQDRLEVVNGDAKDLLKPLVDKLNSIDMFYHDSDHTYAHMMFEFNEVKRKLTPGGLIIGDDISWNASLWDFADQYQVPAYNYKGAVGTAFF